LEGETEFKDVGTYNVYGYPHPETVTLPKYLKGIKRVTNLGLVLPPAYAELIKGMVRLGVTDEKPIEVQGHKIVPLEFAVAYILSQRERLLKGIRTAVRTPTFSPCLLGGRAWAKARAYRRR
jgi:saccharopine dehydrogenase (NAD+, L-lysine-forming)